MLGKLQLTHPTHCCVSSTLARMLQCTIAITTTANTRRRKPYAKKPDVSGICDARCLCVYVYLCVCVTLLQTVHALHTEELLLSLSVLFGTAPGKLCCSTEAGTPMWTLIYRNLVGCRRPASSAREKQSGKSHAWETEREREVCYCIVLGRGKFVREFITYLRANDRPSLVLWYVP